MTLKRLEKIGIGNCIIKTLCRQDPDSIDPDSIDPDSIDPDSEQPAYD